MILRHLVLSDGGVWEIMMAEQALLSLTKVAEVMMERLVAGLLFQQQSHLKIL